MRDIMAKIVNHKTRSLAEASTEKKEKAMTTKQAKAFDPYATAKAAGKTTKRLRVPKESPMLDIDDQIKHEVKAANKRLARPVGSMPVMSSDQVELGYYEFYDYKINDKAHQFLRAYVWVNNKAEMVIASGQDPKAAARTILAKYNQRNKTSKALYRPVNQS